MELRVYTGEDFLALWQLFHDTVHKQVYRQPAGLHRALA